MSKSNGDRAGVIARVLVERPDRVAAAWRRMRFGDRSSAQTPECLLESLVESFIAEIGHSLRNVPGSAWSRARGVLRLNRGTAGLSGLQDEFADLRRCLLDAVNALGGSTRERYRVHGAIDEALESAAALCQRLDDPNAAPPRIPFGGVVVEHFQKATPRPATAPRLYELDVH